MGNLYGCFIHKECREKCKKVIRVYIVADTMCDRNIEACSFLNRERTADSMCFCRVAVKAVNYCDRIYHEEHLLEDCTAEERYEKRLEKVKPVLDEMFAYLESITVSSSCDLGKAVNYALNEKKYLYTFRIILI